MKLIITREWLEPKLASGDEPDEFTPVPQRKIMTVRAKFTLTSITSHAYGGKTLKFQALYDQSIPEDQRFQKATPSGQFEMTVDNPAALEQFVLGQSYYLDMTPAS